MTLRRTDPTWIDVDDATLAKLADRHRDELAPEVSVRVDGAIVLARIEHDGASYGLRLARPAPSSATLELVP